MTEAEWFASTDPQEMLRHYCGGIESDDEGRLVRPSPRKLRLFAAACCRSIWASLTDADGEATADERTDALGWALNAQGNTWLMERRNWPPYLWTVLACNSPTLELSGYHGRNAEQMAMALPEATQADILRHLVRPFGRPVWSEVCARCTKAQGEIDKLLNAVEKWARTPSHLPGGTCEDGAGAGAALAAAQSMQYDKTRCPDCSGLGYIPTEPRPSADMVRTAEACYAGAVNRSRRRCECGGEYTIQPLTSLPPTSVCLKCRKGGPFWACILESEKPDQNLYAVADACLEAGMTLLAEHFKRSEWCMRGCWAMDAILGKE